MLHHPACPHEAVSMKDLHIVAVERIGHDEPWRSRPAPGPVAFAGGDDVDDPAHALRARIAIDALRLRAFLDIDHDGYGELAPPLGEVMEGQAPA